MLKYIHSYLTYELLFGRRMPLEQIIQMIKDQVTLDRFLPILSQLASIRGYNSPVFKSDFLSFMQSSLTNALLTESGSEVQTADIVKIHKHLKDTVKTHALYSDQGLLTLWKYVLLYGEIKFGADDPKQIDFQYMLAFRLNILLSDHLSPPPNYDILSEMFRNYIVNNNQNFSHVILRAVMIYTQIAHDSQRFNPDEFISIREAFEDHYGYSIDDYIAAVFGIYTMFATRINNKQVHDDWFQSIERAFSTTKLRDIAGDILKPLTFTLDESREELHSPLKSTWDFRYFMKRPLFNFQEDIVIPVSLPLLENALADRLFWHIRECFPEEDTNFQRFFGRPFELYVQDMISHSCEKSPVLYEIIPETTYGSSNTRSPDVLIRLGSKLLAIETKAQRLKYVDSIINGDLDSIEKDRLKMIFKPLKQVYTRVKELLGGASHEIDLNGIDEVFLVGVNQGDFPTLTPLERKNNTDLSQLTGISFPVHFYHMDIEELEILAGLLERDISIFRLLRHKLNFPQYSFKTFLHDQRIKYRLPSLLEEEFSILTDRIINHLEVEKNI